MVISLISVDEHSGVLVAFVTLATRKLEIEKETQVMQHRSSNHPESSLQKSWAFALLSVH